MKHVERITFKGDEAVYGIQAGYCSDIESFVVRCQSGWIYDYSIYFAIDEGEYKQVIRYQDRLNSGSMQLEQVVPRYHARYVGAGYIRGYDIIPFSSGTTFKPYLYKDGPFLCADGLFYFHLYWQGHHYAAVPRLWSGIRTDGDRRIRTGPYRERPDISLIKVINDGIELPLCYGREVSGFEGIDEWESMLSMG